MIGETVFDVPGLAAEVEILVDRWGVPHIYASGRDDLFLAQGFNAARDRLFQIDLWLRRGNGRLAEVFGPAFVEQDRASRLFRYRGDMRAEWLAYGTATRAVVTAFAAGYDAFVAWALEDPRRLPPEFGARGYAPGRFSPEDFVRFRTHGLFYNAEHEIARATTLRHFGPEAEELRQSREPADPLRVPDGLDLAAIRDEAMRVYRLAFSPVDFSGLPSSDAWRSAVSGSNNWVVSPGRTSTGRPILANDPHRAVTMPGLRYLAHLSAPGIDAIGAGEPGLPGISIGHNASVAFGLTIWPADQEDVYVYELDPGDPSRYRYGEGWERMRVESEEVPVAGSAPETIELAFTRHGPVIHVDPAAGIAIAVRAVWLEPGMAPYLASLEYLTVDTAEEFVEALARWGAPAVNQVYATVDGSIGWQTSALIPRRPTWDGSLPVPGDGRYEWDGFALTSELPGVRDPEAGWLQTANEMNLPADYRNDVLTTTYDWYSYNRARRIEGWLAADDRVSVEGSHRMQFDTVNPQAVELVSLLGAVDASAVAERGLLEALRAWDGDERADGIEALLFEVWVRRHLRPWLLRRHLRREGLGDALIDDALRILRKDESFGGDLRGELRMLRGLDAADADDLTAGVDATLSAAVEEIRGLLGDDRSGWTWGALHHTRLVNVALEGVDGVPAEWVVAGPAPRGGSGDTVGNAGYDANFRQSIGSSFRMVLDVGEWDASLAMNAPGQSGDPRSPHYRDLFEAWVAGGAFPLLYSRARIEENATHRIRLRPPG